MPYCNWCNLESETENVCVWCKRPYSSGPSLFNNSKKSDIHFIRTDDDSSEMQLPIFAFLGVIVFIGVIGFAWYSFKHNAPESGSQNVAQVSKPSDTDEVSLKYDLNQNHNPQAAPQPSFSAPPTVAPQYSASGNAEPSPMHTSLPFQVYGAKGDGPSSILMFPVLWPDQVDHFSDVHGATLYFETAKFNRAEVNGKEKLVGDVVVSNDGVASVSGAKMWLKIGATTMTLVPYTGTIDNPGPVSSLTIPSKKSTAIHVYANGYTPGMNLKLRSEVGLDGQISGQPVHITGQLGS